MDFIDFLIEAKKNTYANKNILESTPTRQCSKDYTFEGEVENKKAVDHDTYFGGARFMGHEVVYVDGVSVWGMLYYGYGVGAEVDPKIYNDVLRPALMKLDKTDPLPVRGNRKFKAGDYTYTFSSRGTLENFSGVEKIRYKHRLVYGLKCCGGIIK